MVKCHKCGFEGTKSEVGYHVYHTHTHPSGVGGVVRARTPLPTTPPTPRHVGGGTPHITPPQTIPKTIRKVVKSVAVEVCAHCPQCGCPLGCTSMPSECPRCGVKLEWSEGQQATQRCPGCGFPKVPEGGKVCPGCGAKLKWT